MSCCLGRGKFVLAEISLILVTLPLVDLLSPVVPKVAVCPPASAASPSASAPSEPPSCQGLCRVHWLVLGEIQPCTEKAGAGREAETSNSGFFGPVVQSLSVQLGTGQHKCAHQLSSNRFLG